MSVRARARRPGADFVPDFSKESWEEDLKDFRRQSEGITDEMLVVLIGDMVTEEALPTYQTLLNTFEGADDPTGVSQNPWSKWSRKWTSEENRHGDLLNRYLYLTGRCDMRAIEVTIQRLITSGFNAGANKDPYRGFIYTSFQERATKISHGNVGKIAKKQGDSNLARICATIAGDEARHEKARRSPPFEPPPMRYSPYPHLPPTPAAQRPRAFLRAHATCSHRPPRRRAVHNLLTAPRPLAAGVPALRAGGAQARPERRHPLVQGHDGQAGQAQA